MNTEKRIGSRFEIKNGGLDSHRTIVHMDGVDISRHCQRVAFQWQVNEVNQVELSLLAVPDEIDTEALVSITPSQARLLVDLGWTAPQGQELAPPDPASS